MHSRIIELSSQPVNVDERITEDTIIGDYNGAPPWSDYVSDVDDEEAAAEDIKWLCEHLGVKHYRVSKEPGRGFLKTAEVIAGLKVLVKKDIESARPSIDKLMADIAIDKFERMYWGVLDVEDKLDSKSGFHYYIGDPSCCSHHVGGNLGLLDTLLHGKYGDKLYIGGIVDYHS